MDSAGGFKMNGSGWRKAWGVPGLKKEGKRGVDVLHRLDNEKKGIIADMLKNFEATFFLGGISAEVWEKGLFS